MKKMNLFGIIVLFFILAIGVEAALSDVKDISISLVNHDPDPAIAGDTLEIRLGVENTGGIASENLILEIIPDYPFEAVPGEGLVQNVGAIQQYQSGSNMRIVKFKVRVNRDATAGEYALKIKEYEEGRESTAGINSLGIDVQSRESAEVIHIDKTTLVPGKQTSLKFVINNVGSAPLRELTFSWINEDNIILPVGSDNTKYIKYIDLGEGAELEYEVIADSNADAGLYKLDLQLTYDDPVSGDEKEINTIAGVYVGGGTDFDIAFSESSSGQTSFTIANVGSNPAFSVSVIIPQQQGWRTTGSNSMIIGNLNKGDYTVASFGLQSTQARQATADQQKDMSREELIAARASTQTQSALSSLKIQIAYTDTMGERKLVEKSVSINPQAMMSLNTDSLTSSQTTGSQATMASFRRAQQQSFFSKYKWYFTVIIVFLVLGGGYMKYKKEKHHNPRFKIKGLFSLSAFKKKSK